jgi:hypothetical protein
MLVEREKDYTLGMIAGGWLGCGRNLVPKSRRGLKCPGYVLQAFDGFHFFRMAAGLLSPLLSNA